MKVVKKTAGAATVIRHIATIAHSGGLRALSEGDALKAIRRLTLPYFDRTANEERAGHAVDAALEGAAVRDYLATIGSKGGKVGGKAAGARKARGPEHYAAMVAARKAKRKPTQAGD